MDIKKINKLTNELLYTYMKKNIKKNDNYKATAMCIDTIASLDQSKASTFYKSEIKFLKIGKLGLILP